MATLTCPACTAAVQQDDLICFTCGANLPRDRPVNEPDTPPTVMQEYLRRDGAAPAPRLSACPHCGSALSEPSSLFCLVCGQPLPQPPSGIHRAHRPHGRRARYQPHPPNRAHPDSSEDPREDPSEDPSEDSSEMTASNHEQIGRESCRERGEI